MNDRSVGGEIEGEHSAGDDRFLLNSRTPPAFTASPAVFCLARTDAPQ
jgi:hypothetical protein